LAGNLLMPLLVDINGYMAQKIRQCRTV